MAPKAWAVGMVSHWEKHWSKNHWRKARERRGRGRRPPEDGAGTLRKARPSAEVKGVPRSAMRRKASKPDGPWGLGGVRVGIVSNSTYSMGEREYSEFQDLKWLKSGEKRKLKVASPAPGFAWDWREIGRAS